MLVTVIAAKSFHHAGRRTRGESFSVSARHAQQLLERKLVTLPPQPAPAAPAWSEIPGSSQFVCIASGPSLTAEDCEVVRLWRERTGGRVIVVNTSYRMAPWADVLYACDTKWWDESIDAVRRTTAAELWTQSKDAARRHGLQLINGRRGKGLGRDAVHYGGNSGYQAVNLAYLWGAKRIVLLGYDMQHTGRKGHWHGDHPWKLGVKPPVRDWIPRFSVMAEGLVAEGVEVINATRETALTCFARQAIELALGGER